MRAAYRLRLAANVLNGSTLAGIVVATAGGATLRPAGDGLLAGSGYRLPVPAPPAFCLGNVLVTKLGHAEFTGETRLFRHEARHATQYACCGGLVMLPLYGIAAAVSWALTGDSGARNVFEQRAGLADGGYTEKDLRPFLRFIVISRALALADAEYLLNRGGVVFNGKPRDIADDPFRALPRLRALPRRRRQGALTSRRPGCPPCHDEGHAYSAVSRSGRRWSSWPFGYRGSVRSRSGVGCQG